jgi:hypothetical protein
MKILAVTTMERSALKPPSQEDMARMGTYIEELRRKGTLISTGGASPNAIELTVTRKRDAYRITDGPFTEAKEVVGGFALLDVSGRDEAIEISRRFLEIVGDATCHLHEVTVA